MANQNEEIERIERKGDRSRRPTHPGEILEKEYLQPLGLTQAELADHINRDVKTINRLVNERTSLTPDLAQRLAATFETTPGFWMNLQSAVDLYDAEQSADDLPEPIWDQDADSQPTVR